MSKGIKAMNEANKLFGGIFDGKVIEAIQGAIVETAPAIPFAAWGITYMIIAYMAARLGGELMLNLARSYKEIR